MVRRAARPAARCWALIPGVLRAFFATNEIITSLMLNYVAGSLLDVPDLRQPLVLARHVRRPRRRSFPQGKALPDDADLADARTSHGIVSRSGSCSRSRVAVVLWVLYARTRFGFEMQVIGDSARAARYAGMRTRRKILAVMCLSGAIAGLGGASQDGDFRHLLDPRGLRQANYGYTGHRRRRARALQPVRRRASSRSCSAACRTPASRCRGRTSRPGSSA